MKQGKLSLVLVVSILSLFVAGISFGMSESEDKNIKDSRLKTAVDNTLLFDDMVSAHLIDEQVSDGVVILSGKVSNMLEKDRAVRLAKTVKGVRTVVDKLEVVPAYRKDRNIRLDVVDTLLVDPATDSYEVKVRVDDGIVSLKGTVDSWSEKMLVEKLTKGVRGVKGIENDITVKLDTTRPDYELKKEIEKNLKFNPYIQHGLITVSVDKGEVKLLGTVSSAAEKSDAYVEAWVTGVRSVDTGDLDVKWWAGEELKRKSEVAIKSDEEIKKAIQDAFLYDPRVFSFEIDSDVMNGQVTLRGTVDNLAAKKAAEDDAGNTLGVWRVKNYIKVRPAKLFTDKTLKKRVTKALKRNPLVNKKDINVVIKNQKAYLYGRVDYFFEKDTAEDLASNIIGVVDVDNNIKLDFVWDWKSDKAIKEDVNSEIFWDFFVDSADVKVKVDDGTVTLKGKVTDKYELRAAIRNAFEGGAKRVKNDLKVARNIGGIDYFRRGNTYEYNHFPYVHPVY